MPFQVTGLLTPVKPDRSADYTLLFGMLRPYVPALLLALVLMLAQSLVTLVNPWLAGRFAAAVMAKAAVAPLLLLWFGVVAVQAALTWAVNTRLLTIGEDISVDLGTRAFDHLQSLPMSWHQDRRHGDVLALLILDASRLSHFVSGTLTPLLPLLLTCGGALYMMYRVQPWFALAAAILLPAMFISMRLVGRRLRPLGHQATQAYATRSAVAEQSLAMLPIVKAFTGETAQSQRFFQRSRELRDVEVKLARYNVLISPLVRVVAAAAILGLLWVASNQVAAGELSPADLVSLLLYGLLLAQPISALAGVYGQVHTAQGTAQRLLNLFTQSPEPDDGQYAPESVRGEVRFESVSFAHPDRPPLLEQVDLHIKAGETIAITGVNGAGKTSLANLLMRYFDPDQGRILLDGHDLREFRLNSLRGHIGLVSQNVLLFHASIRDNIAYGRIGADDEAIEQAARMARAHEFVSALPDGYDTHIGDQGVKLSGGQKQRIALARALLKNPAILILDEATAMFDPDAEHAFVDQCRAALAQRTVLLITHRPASLALADRVLRLEQRRLHEVVAA